MDGQWVMMPVRCMSKKCEFCKYLDIEIERSDIYAEGEYQTSQNIMQCKNVHRCEMLKKMMEEENA